MRFAVVVFPGTSCDHDVHHVIKDVLGHEAVYVWHKDQTLQGADVVVLPGGSSHGDYLRPGALVRHSPIINEIAAFAQKGGPVLGIGNGFQILTEVGLLPGALTRNAGLRFVCRDQHLVVDGKPSRFTSKWSAGSVTSFPIAHGAGCFQAPAETLSQLENEGRVVLRYADAEGRVSEAANPNGSQGNIAGIASETFNVVGMMPHPERATESILGSELGRGVFESVLG